MFSVFPCQFLTRVSREYAPLHNDLNDGLFMLVEDVSKPSPICDQLSDGIGYRNTQSYRPSSRT